MRDGAGVTLDLVADGALPAGESRLRHLRMTVRTRDKRMAEGFSRLFPWLGLSGPPYAGGLRGSERSRELLGLWPTLVRREAIEPRVAIDVEAVA